MLIPEIRFSGIRNEYGENLLHYLCRTCDVIELFTMHNIINNENRRFLMQYNAKHEQCVHIVASLQEDAVGKMKLLTMWGANVNGKELKRGDTPLHIAVRVKNYALVEWLCQQKNINRETLNNDLMTPFHIAFGAKDDRMMKILKQNGANCKIPLQSESNSADEDEELLSKILTL